ncbi:ribosome recycling factor [Acidobacteriia bacterium AH_259_A11_L15]|nr:ribosome recycling factor [Acidobacteriia bacterium AH_259_A11_L15]
MQPVATIKEALAQTRKRMDKTVEDFRRELGHLRTGRASVTLLEDIRVDYYGTATPVNQLAKLAAPEATLIVVQPFDPSITAAVEKAIRSSDLGLNPASDGKIIRVPVPPLTEERRRDMVKHLHTVLENHKTALRNIRRDSKASIEALFKDKKVSEDDKHHGVADLDKLTHEYTEKLDSFSKNKEKEILEI